jgi:PHP family Zn ribbon phosphoesterase
MSPVAIVRRAKKRGLDVIGICDHNSTKNVAAVHRAGRREDLAVIGGVEVCSEEEVHVLGLFDDQEGLEQMQQLIDQNLGGENNPELLGSQDVCDEDGAIIGRETKLLIGAVRLSVDEIVDSIHRFGGLAVASHVDRESFSLFSQLGFVPPGLPVDALEISPLHSVAEALESLPQISGYPLVSFSDAHRLEEIGTAFTTFAVLQPCIEELHKALSGEGGREVMN